MKEIVFQNKNMALDSGQIYSYVPKKHHRLAILLGVLILLAGGYFYWQYYYQNQAQNTKVPPKSQRLEYQTKRVDHAILTLPDEFPQSLVLANATPLESYNLVFTQTDESKDGILVMESNQSLEEIKKYYQGFLKIPEYQFIQGSDAADTTSKKTLVYSTNTGIVVIKIEASPNGSKTTITNSNIIRGLRLEQNAK